MNLLHRVAGIDQEVMKQCPGIDRIWATQLGISLLIGFCFVFLISYYSISYFVTYEPARIGVALLIAAVVGLFDRALFQSDWYYMGLVQQVRDSLRSKPGWADRFRIIVRYTMRIVFRLGISLLIAYTLSLFVEIAVFGDAISEKIQAKFNIENQEFKRRLQEEVDAIDARFPAIEQRINRVTLELSDRAQRTPAITGQDEKLNYDRIVQQIQTKERDVATLRNAMLENDKAIRGWSDDVEAERRGVRLRADHTGRVGCGAVCQTKLGMIANAQAENTELRGRHDKIAGELGDLEKQRAAITDNYERADAAIVEERRGELASLQRQLAESQAYRASRLREKEQELKQIGLFSARLDDPIIRVRYLRELKEDPEKGEIVSEFSLMIRLFIMFLEIAPVIGKMFFSPPSAYAFKIRADVGKEQIEALVQLDAKVEVYQRQHDANLGSLDELIEKRRSRIEAGISLDQAKADYFKRKQEERS